MSLCLDVFFGVGQLLRRAVLNLGKATNYCTCICPIDPASAGDPASTEENANLKDPQKEERLSPLVPEKGPERRSNLIQDIKERRR